jgi:Flp pilus assembly protein TadD
MSELGNGSIREVFEATGGMKESMSRATFSQDNPKVKELLENHAKQDLLAKSIGKYEASRRDDLTGPFRLELEALECRLSVTGLDDAGVATAPWQLFQDVPYALKTARQADDKDDQTRQHGFVFPEPYRAELRYKIIPPPLFKVANVPQSQEVKIGTGTYSRSYETNPDGSFEAVFQFDTGKRRLTPEEFETYRADLKKYDEMKPELITFYPETAEYVALGQSGKALAMVREAAAAHPESAMSHVRLSHMLLTAHLGGPARSEAQKATELDPKSSTAWQALAAAYGHDTFGRIKQGNWNGGESEKAYRKAVELDPDDQIARMNLAILLEYNAHGWRYAKDSRLNDAITLYREMLKKPENPQVEQNLAIALLRAGQFDEAKAEAKKTEAAFQVTMLSMISAIQEGPARAIVNAQTSYPDPAQRAQFLTNVGVSLTQVRQYSAAQAIFNAAARLGSVPGVRERAELIGKIKRWDDALLPEDDPRWPVQHLMLEISRGNLTREAMEPLVSKRADFSDMESGLAGIQNSLASMHRQFSSVGLEEEALADVIASMIEFDKDGDDAHGYRIGGNVRGSGMPAIFVVREDGKYKVIGAGADGAELIGALVLELLAKHDLAGAQWWLDRVAHDVEAHADGTGLPVIKSMWSGVTPESRGADAVRLAAQVLIATSTGKAEAIQKLTQARPKAANALDRTLLDKAICESLVKAKNWEGLLPAARQLQASRMFSEEGFRYYLMAAKGMRKWPELAAEAKKRYDGNNSNEAAVKALVLAEAGQGNWTRAAEWAKKIDKNGIFQVEQAETEAWTALIAGSPTDETLAALHKVKDLAAQQMDYRYTDAMLEAALHKPEEATEALLRGIADEDYFHLHPAAWVAYARICEQYGYPGEAEKAMAMARKTVHDDDDITDWVNALLNGRPTEKK